MKIYIAGKITNNPTYIEDFEKVEKELTELGHVVLNPAKLPNGLGYENCMHICFAMIDTVDAVYLLPNWKDSKGANREFKYASEKFKYIVDNIKDLEALQID
jgi:hypothetical protein